MPEVKPFFPMMRFPANQSGLRLAVPSYVFAVVGNKVCHEGPSQLPSGTTHASREGGSADISLSRHRFSFFSSSGSLPFT
jgi:hypothetical protein